MLIRFILSGGKHFYDKAKNDLLDQIKSSGSKHTFIMKDNKRFEYVGVKEEIPTFREANIVDIKVACRNLSMKLANTNVKLAAELIETGDKEDIEEFIKHIGIPRNSSKVQKMRELKKKDHLYGKDEAMMKVLWWESKRDALREQMQALQISTQPSQERNSFLSKVLSELNKRISEAVRKYQDFPEARD